MSSSWRSSCLDEPCASGYGNKIFRHSVETVLENNNHGEHEQSGKNRSWFVLQNTDIAQRGWAVNELADPAVGEAYGVARTVEPITGETAFHIAAVVAKDGTDNITLEAEASTARPEPIFDMYGTIPSSLRPQGDQSLTFHKTYQDVYTSRRLQQVPNRRRRHWVDHEHSTGVLRPRTD